MDMIEIEKATRPAMLDVQTVAKIFGISAAGVYVNVARGDLESVKVGGRVKVLSGPIRAMLRLPPVGAVSATA